MRDSITDMRDRGHDPAALGFLARHLKAWPMQDAMQDVPRPAAPALVAPRLEYFPVAMFGAVMGLSGLSVAWRMAHRLAALPAWVGDTLAVLAVLAFGAVFAAYATKLVTAPDAVMREFRHPIAGNTFATFFVSLLLLPLVVAPWSLALARALWTAGACGIGVLAWHIVRSWLSEPHELSQATPAWLLAVVGLLDMPLAVPSLGVPQLRSLMVPGLAVGLFLAVPLFTVVFSRLVFGPPLPASLEPQLLMLLAPSAVGLSTYMATTGTLDLFARGLFDITLFLLAVLLGRVRMLGACCPFRVAWWAVSFPMAATTIAALQIARVTASVAACWLALALLALTTAVIAWLLGRTLLGIARGELRALSQ